MSLRHLLLLLAVSNAGAAFAAPPNRGTVICSPTSVTASADGAVSGLSCQLSHYRDPDGGQPGLAIVSSSCGQGLSLAFTSSGSASGTGAVTGIVDAQVQGSCSFKVVPSDGTEHMTTGSAVSVYLPSVTVSAPSLVEATSGEAPSSFQVMARVGGQAVAGAVYECEPVAPTAACPSAGVLDLTPGTGAGLLTSSGTSATHRVRFAAQVGGRRYFAPQTTLTEKAFTPPAPAPGLLRISSTTADGTYGVGKTIDVSLVFSEPVKVTSTKNFKVVLETGSADREATYVSGSGSATLRMRYIVQTGDESSDLAALSITALPGSVTTVAGSKIATLTIPSGQNLSDLRNIAVGEAATVAPAVAFDAPNPSTVTSANDDAFPVSGGCAPAGGSVAVRALGQKGSPVQANCAAGAHALGGVWSTSLDLSSAPTGILTLAAVATSPAGTTSTQATINVTKAAAQLAPCTYEGQQVASGQQISRERFPSGSVPFGQTCAPETQTATCTDGVLSTFSGTATHLACQPASPAACSYDGRSIAHGETARRERFPAASVPFGQSCVAEEQTALCTNGVLATFSGSATNDTCATAAAASCSHEGSTVAHGAAATRERFPTPTVPFGQSCVPEIQTATCTDGTLSPFSGNATLLSCTPAAPAACEYEGSSIAHGESATRELFPASTVPFGETCQAETQSALCTNGVLGQFSGTATNLTCSPLSPASCVHEGATIAHGAIATRLRYPTATVPFGQTCLGESQTATCSNGTLSAFSGSATILECNAAAPASCTFEGQPLAHGASATRERFETASVAYDQQCSKEIQTGTCSNGTVTVTPNNYAAPTCSPAAALACTYNGSQVAHGQNASRVMYQAAVVPAGSQCQQETQNATCSNGVLGSFSGVYTAASCSQETPPTVAVSLAGAAANGFLNIVEAQAATGALASATASPGASVQYAVAPAATTCAQVGVGSFGSASPVGTSFSSLPDGVYAICARATATFGSEARSRSANLVVDRSPPTVTAPATVIENMDSGSPIITANASGHNTVLWSGISGGEVYFGTPSQLTTWVTGGGVSFAGVIRVTVADPAGNTAYQDVQYIADLIPPHVSLSPSSVDNGRTTSLYVFVQVTNPSPWDGSALTYRHKVLPGYYGCADYPSGYGPTQPLTQPIQDDLSSLPDGQFSLCVVGIDAAGNSSNPAFITWTKDLTAYQSPTGLSVSSTSASVTLSWDPGMIGESYIVARKLASSPEELTLTQGVKYQAGHTAGAWSILFNSTLNTYTDTSIGAEDYVYAVLTSDQYANHSAPVTVSASRRVWKALSAGGDATCALYGTDAYCWGRRLYSSFGDGVSGTGEFRTPRLVLGGHAWRQVSLGQDLGNGTAMGCGVTQTDELYCWGRSEIIGFWESTPVRVAAPRTFKSVSVGAGLHACAIDTDDDLYCWGTRDLTGPGFGVQPYESVTTPTLVAGGQKWRQVSAGYVHTCGITTSYELYCFGRNENGELGIGSADQTVVHTPQKINFPATWIDVSAGGHGTCAIYSHGDNSGEIRCWGCNSYGQYGNGSSTGSQSCSAHNQNTSWSPTSSASVIKPYLISHWTDVEVSRTGSQNHEQHVCARSGDGRSFCWGADNYYQLGRGQATWGNWGVMQTAPAYPVASTNGQGSLEPVSAISAGFRHSCAISNGELLCWGANGGAQLGPNEFDSYEFTPVVVPPPN